VAKRITVDATEPMEFGFTYGKKINSLVTWPPPVPDIRNGVDFRPPTHRNDITISYGSIVSVTGTDTNTYYPVVRLEYNKSTNVFSLISEGV
jgi:hypothetical protein